jgi:type II secretory ATPase GspE/PulE/Tfp pilus assembly ATPase PilB-like protein
MRERIREYAAQGSGLIVISGPPFSGVTTTTRAVMRTVDVYLYSCFSLADMGSRELPNVTPFKLREASDNFATSVMRMKRLEADVIYIDPIKTAARAKEVFAELDKAVMICELPAKDAVHALLQLAEWVGSLDEVIKNVSLSISTKLIRKLCEDCKEAYRPHPKLLQKIGLPPETKLLYRPRTPPDPDDPEVTEEDLEPCETCGDVGYVGRTGMYEMVEMTDALKEFLNTSPPYAAIKTEVRKLGQQTTQKEGLRLVAEGVTSLEELQRVFRPSK